MYTYFLILNDFGIRPGTVWQLSELRLPRPRDDDIYDASQSTAEQFKDLATDPSGKTMGTRLYGNSNSGAVDDSDDGGLTGTWQKMAWDKTRNSKIDLRLFYAAKRSADDWTTCRWDPANTAYPGFYRSSHISDGHPICYSSEALKYA